MLHAPDADGFYWDTISGVDLGCTQGGVTVSYSFEKNDIFCDQTLAAVASSIISETAEVSFNMLESDVEHLQYAIQQMSYLETVGVDKKIAVGGVAFIS